MKTILLILLICLSPALSADTDLDVQALMDAAYIKTAIEEYNKNTEEGFKMAFSLYVHAAEKGNKSAASSAYQMFLRKQGISNPDVNWTKKLADLGSLTAVYDLAHDYDDGDGVKKDPAKATELYFAAAKNGHAAAQLDIALRFRNGITIQKDNEKALYWARKSAQQGNAKAQINLGFWLDNSDPENKAESEHWFQTAYAQLKEKANKGDTNALYMAAFLIEGGNGIEKDMGKALSVYELLAAEGHARSQYSLFRIYWNGTGVKQSRMEAMRWLRAAAANGHTLAKKKLAELN